MSDYDVTVIGGGPAGLAAASSASSAGAKVLLIEREAELGGVLKQCIHDGFGVLRYGEKLAGCEYACREKKKLSLTDTEIRLLTFASRIEKVDGGFLLSLTSRSGFEKIFSRSLVLATGCRERTAKQAAIHGTRPAGVLTAGSAQYFINVLGQLPGKRCVILGSGDIGLIMARRLSIEGAKVLGVFEAKPEPSGLMRNIYQCLVDFDIPLHLSHTVTEIHGRERVTSVTISKTDEKMRPIPGTEEEIDCDTLILSVGLIPENELAEALGVAIDPHTRGPVVDQYYQTNVPGIFSCGNALHVNDLVDYVSESGFTAGRYAAAYRKRTGAKAISSNYVSIEPSSDFAYIVPSRIAKPCETPSAPIAFFFRTKKSRGETLIKTYIDDELLFTKHYQSLRPPEMERIEITLEDLGEKEHLRFEMEEISHE